MSEFSRSAQKHSGVAMGPPGELAGTDGRNDRHLRLPRAPARTTLAKRDIAAGKALGLAADTAFLIRDESGQTDGRRVVQTNLDVHLLLRYARARGVIFTCDSSDHTFHINRFDQTLRRGQRTASERSVDITLKGTAPDSLETLAIVVQHYVPREATAREDRLPCSPELADSLHRALQLGYRVRCNNASRRIEILQGRRGPPSVVPPRFRPSHETEGPLAVIEFGRDGLADVKHWQPLLLHKLAEILHDD